MPSRVLSALRASLPGSGGAVVPRRSRRADFSCRPTNAALFLCIHFGHRPFDLGCEHQGVLCKPGEKFFFGCVGRSGGDPVKLGRLLAKLHQLNLHVVHDTLYFGGCKPGELAHSSIWDAVSARWALLRRSSLSGPGRSFETFSLTSLANEARRSFREIVCLSRRRCMTQPRCLRVLTAGFAISDLNTSGGTLQFPSAHKLD